MDAGSDYASYFASITAGYRAKNLTDEEARLYIYDDLGVSQRWANKFSEAGIETVADLVGHTEDELLRIEGIGTKAIEELKAGHLRTMVFPRLSKMTSQLRLTI